MAEQLKSMDFQSNMEQLPGIKAEAAYNKLQNLDFRAEAKTLPQVKLPG